MIPLSPLHALYVLLEAALTIERLVPREDAGRQSTNQMHTINHSSNKYCIALSNHNTYVETTFKIILQIYLNNGFSQGLYALCSYPTRKKKKAGECCNVDKC